MQSTRPENSSLKIDQHDRFFSKLLSKEASAANSSSQILYYYGAVPAVPFVWEACPGTPKLLPPRSYSFDSAHDYNLKPFLTPPPYYLARLGSKFSDTSLEAKIRRDWKFPVVCQKWSVLSPTCSVSSSKSSSSSSWLSSVASPPPLALKIKSFRERYVLLPCLRFDNAIGQDHGDGLP